MATKSNWVVIFDDKKITKNFDEGAGEGRGYIITDDDAFWNQSKFSNIWAIQYDTPVVTDQVEYRDNTPHSSYADANLGDFQLFIDKWDSKQLAFLQSEWDEGYTPADDSPGPEGETTEQKIARLGPRPTTYSSSAP